MIEAGGTLENTTQEPYIPHTSPYVASYVNQLIRSSLEGGVQDRPLASASDVIDSLKTQGVPFFDLHRPLVEIERCLRGLRYIELPSGINLHYDVNERYLCSKAVLNITGPRKTRIAYLDFNIINPSVLSRKWAKVVVPNIGVGVSTQYVVGLLNFSDTDLLGETPLLILRYRGLASNNSLEGVSLYPDY